MDSIARCEHGQCTKRPRQVSHGRAGKFTPSCVHLHVCAYGTKRSAATCISPRSVGITEVGEGGEGREVFTFDKT